MEQLVRLQRLVHMVQQRDVFGVVEIAHRHQSGAAQRQGHALIAGFRQIDLAGFFIELDIALDHAGHQGINLLVGFGLVFGRA